MQVVFAEMPEFFRLFYFLEQNLLWSRGCRCKDGFKNFFHLNFPSANGIRAGKAKWDCGSGTTSFSEIHLVSVRPESGQVVRTSEAAAKGAEREVPLSWCRA
jgi:hypothetical protein